MTIFRLFTVWLCILLLAFANGALRELVLLKLMPRSPAFVLSGVLLMACILVVALLFIRWIGPMTSSQYLLAGILWLVLTMGFEFGFGLLRGQPLTTLLDAYRFANGNIWPAVLAFVAVAPVIAARIRGLL